LAEPSENAEASDSSDSVGSLDAVDSVHEDLNRDAAARATGFMGKPSQVAWMQGLASENLEQNAPETQSQDKSRTSRKETIASVSYHLDDLDIDPPVGLDPYALPDKGLADEFLSAYLETVHHSFPILRRIVFGEQYRRFFQPMSPNPGKKWLAVLNMVFAIGSKYRQLMHGPALNMDDRVYFNRARALSFNGETLLAHSDLQQIQVEGLIAFYLMAIGQVNRQVHICFMLCWQTPQSRQLQLIC
jgi:hypothetical protein